MAKFEFSDADKHLFHRYLNNVHSFVSDYLCGDLCDTVTDYISGSERIDFYSKAFNQGRDEDIEDYRELPELYGGLSYEQALLTRLTTYRDFNVLVLIGGLGAGKTSTINYICRLLEPLEGATLETNCNCSPCLRRPLRIDCQELRRDSSVDRLIQRVLEKIRFELYEALLREWLYRQNLPVDQLRTDSHEFKVLRRLLITNDIATWADPSYPDTFPLELQSPSYYLAKPLLDHSFTQMELQKLIQSYAGKIDALAAPLQKVREDIEKSTNLTALVANFYLAKCSRRNPRNLLVIDNLDQLFTGHIEKICQQLYGLALRIKGLPLLIPLRPSSITPQGFVMPIEYMYHYGPNCALLILYRLQKYVLCRSRNALSARDPGDNLPRVFEKSPSAEELSAFLVATYLYAKILSGDLEGDLVKVTDGTRLLPDVHDDHAFLRRIQFPPDGLRSLAETIKALVGVCGRYAIEQLDRYLKTMYLQPVILTEARRKQVLALGQGKLPLTYGLLITAIVSGTKAGMAKTRLANLFLPPRRGLNPDWPSLAKLRILSLLEDQDGTEVESIVRALAYSGIPADVVFENLNDLHDRDRLLIWFSTNANLQIANPDDMKQYVVASEHGLAYLRHLATDFEYLWFCARNLARQPSPEDPDNFKERLMDYSRLVRQLGETEWKQLIFRSCLSGTREANPRRELIVLPLLYGSLSRLVRGARIALSITSRGDVVRIDEIQSEIELVCSAILRWHRNYELYFGTQHYVHWYAPQISAVEGILRRLLDEKLVVGNVAARAEELLQDWSVDPFQVNESASEVDSSLPPRDDFISLSARYSRGLIPGVKNFILEVDKAEGLRHSVWQYMRGREKLTRLLENRLPTFSDFERYIRYLEGDVNEVLRSARELASTTGETLRWFAEERVRLREECETLHNNRLELSGVLLREPMDDMKRKCNRIMDVALGVAKRLASAQVQHLEARWNIGG